MSQDIGNGRTLIGGSAVGLLGVVRGSSGGLVVACWVEDQVAEELSGGGVDDADVDEVEQRRERSGGRARQTTQLDQPQQATDEQ